MSEIKDDPAYIELLDSGESTPTATHPISSPDIMPAKRKIIIKEEEVSHGCEILRAPAHTMQEFHTLPPSAVILLLTPVITSSVERQHIDPFEALGRAINKRHTRVRHVPYIAKVGFTDTHRAFMQQVDAIIIASVDSLPSMAQLLNDDTSDMADSVFEFVVESTSVPMALIQFGGPSIKLNEEASEVYLKASHAALETFALATCLLFGTDT